MEVVSMKKVQIGARISQEDAEFISQLKIEGAHTPSDKLRAIIENARSKAEYSYDFAGSYRSLKSEINPIVEYVKEAENSQNIHSAVVERVFEWMPEFYAYCLSTLNPDDENNKLQEFEKGVVEKLFRLFESLLHLELSKQSTSYSDNVVKSHFESINSLMQIIQNTTTNKEG